MNTTVSQREREVLRLISHEYRTYEIADILCISTHTVDSHKKNLFSKLGVSNTAGVVRKGFELGLLKINYPEPSFG